MGMGGAFIAVADDATAASWNPGGLIQLERPEISVVGTYRHRIEDNDFGTNPEASGRQTVSDADLNYLSVVYPFTLHNLNMVVSINYQNLFDFKSRLYSHLLLADQVSGQHLHHLRASDNILALFPKYANPFQLFKIKAQRTNKLK